MLNIIWMDPNIDGDDENKNYVEELKQNVNYKVKGVKTVQEGIIEINKILFEETIIIVSGKLFKEFIDEFKKNLNNLCFMPNIIVFTANINQFLLSLDNNFRDKIIDDNFYNSGGVQTDFFKILEFIKNPKKNKKILLSRDNDGCFCFDYIDTPEKLALPLFYKYLIKFTEQDDKKYYEKSEKIKEILDSINTELPIELLAKFYIRMYTDEESRFYSDLNRDLRNNKRDNYLHYIKVLYEGVKLKSLPLAQEHVLFRAANLSTKEKDKFISFSKKKKIEGLPGAIVFSKTSKTFLSFTKDIEIANEFLGNTSNDNNLIKALFILTKDDIKDDTKDDNVNYSLSTHADIEKISLIPEEREVLFFPFSSFEIENVVVGREGIYHIRLLYLGKYLKIIENNPNLKEQTTALPSTEFTKELFNSPIIENIKKEEVNSKVLHKKFIDNKNDLYKRRNPVYHKYQKDPIYTFSPLSNNFVEYQKPYVLRRFEKNEKEIIYNPPKFNKNVIAQQFLLKTPDGKPVMKENYIIAHFNIIENDINKNIRIINSSHYKGDNDLRFTNEKELINNCKIKICNKIDNQIVYQEFKFNYFLSFHKSDKYVIQYLFTNNLTRADFLFAECPNLVYLDLLHFNCQYVTNMVCMFLGCINLQEIKISNIDTSKVEDMNCMFYGCKSLKRLDLSFFETPNVVNMSRLFFGCSSLSSINLSSFNTLKVVNMYGMFEGCVSLQELNLSNIYTQNVINMNRMFFSCRSLKKLNLSSFKTNKVAYMNSMFYGCSSLYSLDISNFNIDNVVNMEEMFTGCSALNIENINFKDKANLIKRSRFYEKNYYK